MCERMVRSEAYWKRVLTPEQFGVTRRKGTEPAYSGRYNDFTRSGVYCCACCGSVLFRSDAKFTVRSKWPTFWEPAAKENIRTSRHILHFMIRNEVMCACCDAHLGYVFEDGRPPAGVRYFINSCALLFVLNRRRAARASPSLAGPKPADHPALLTAGGPA